MVQNICSVIYSISCGNTHHDIKYFEVDGMARNMKDLVEVFFNFFITEIPII